jgi:hypothetical protein
MHFGNSGPSVIKKTYHHRLPSEISQDGKQTFQISKYVQGI